MKRSFFLPAARRALCCLLALCLLSAAIPLSASAEAAPGASSVTHVGTYHYMSNEGTDLTSIYTTDTFLYNDNWFLSDGREYNSHLATLSAAASISSAGFYGGDKTDFSQHSNNVREFLSQMQFEEIESNTYYQLESDQNSASCIMGHKTVGSGNSARTLLVILPMSANYGQEWNGNFFVEEAGLHRGFKEARDECLRFFKQYVTEHQITGDVKLWTAGHSRGSAIANLIASFFALGCGDYFDGCDLTIAPENIYAYTFATPGTVTESGVTLAQVLGVAGSRADYPNDTPGDTVPYIGIGADAEVDPSSEVFSCVHNCRPSYDLITLLPPYQWGFTVFGSTFEITDGEASTKNRMKAWLKEADVDVYNAYLAEYKLGGLISTGSHGDEDEYAWKKLNLSTFSIADNGELTMSEMMAKRIQGLYTLANDRAFYTETYQEVFRAVFGIYGLAEAEFTANLDVTSEIKMLLINYLAYASERMGGDDAAAAEFVAGLYRYLSDEEVDPQTITVKEITSKYAWLINNAILLKFFLPGLIPEDLQEKLCAIMGIQSYQFSLTINSLLEQLASGNAATSAAGFDSLCKIVLKLLEEEGDLTALANAIGKTDDGVFTGTGKLIDVVSAALDLTLKDESENRIPLSQAADQLLTASAASLGEATIAAISKEGFSEKIVADLTGYFRTVAENPAKARRILFHLISYTDGDQPFDFAKELRTLVTFFAQSNKIRFAHYNELYVAWMRAQDSAYRVPLGDSDEDQKVTILDATAIQRLLASLSVSSLHEMAADVDRDGEVTILDATNIQRHLARLSCPDGIGEPVV